jgi:hypothetical protein
MDEEHQSVIDERASLVEMYKAGFLDGYSHSNKLKTKEEWDLMNKFYLKAFTKRFMQRIKKVLKE